MAKPSTKKVCIVTMSLANGGAERSSALLSRMLYKLGYEVHILTVLDDIDYDYKGKLYNLGAFKSKRGSIFNRIKRFRLWKSYMKAHNFDYVIDNRTRIGFIKELLITKFIYDNKNTIYTVHSYNITSYLNKNVYPSKYLYHSALAIVTVSEAIKELIEGVYNFKNVKTIYNPICNSLHNSIIDAETKPNTYILFYGRLNDEVKNISLLLQAYKLSQLSKQHIRLKILGDGKDLNNLKALAITLDIDAHVDFLSYIPHPEPIVANALFSVLTSRYEGFPMVLIESLSLGTPVVSVDCQSGPKEVVVDKHNGLLVENYNVKALADAFNSLVNDKALYYHCKQNAKSSVAHLRMDNIAQSWKQILN